MTPPAIAGLILSGGASRRMGSPKALLYFEGQTFLDHLIEAFSPLCRPLIVVLGRDADRIRAGILRSAEVQFVVNPDPDRGMFSSLQCGLRELPQSAPAVIFTPVDCPEIEAGTVRRLARAFKQGNNPVVLPRHAGETGHPVCISRHLIEQLLALPVDAQARDVIRSYRSQTCFVEVENPGILHDVDEPQAYRALQAREASLEQS